ncbi:hypothetical protein AB0M35_28015 [Micromonospora sp. NPDC051196]|uniref:hypothetical protein n=1 Tax=Micromonospora sp. NPDC051196 TaxID=3155281 RepID=UPI00343D492C
MTQQLWPVILGALLAIGGGYLGARWQGQQQRANLLHEARIALYTELLADCRLRRVHTRESPVPYSPAPMSLQVRMELFASHSVQEAWAEMESAEAQGVMLGVVGARRYPTGVTLLISPAEGRWLRSRFIDRVEAAIRSDLVPAPMHSVWWERTRSWSGYLHEELMWIMKPSVRKAASQEIEDLVMLARHRVTQTRKTDSSSPSNDLLHG